MRLATFSDIHLGPSPSLDKFGGNEDRLLHFADHLERDHDQIVLLGDIYQTDYGTLPGSRSEVLEASIARYPAISERWRSQPYDFIYGNHDQIASRELGAIEQRYIQVDDWRIWLIHGHQFDPLIGAGATPYRGTWTMGWLRRLKMNFFVDFLEGPLFLAGQRLARPWGALDLAAERSILQGDHDVVVMGHSHIRACQPVGAGVYANSGAGDPETLSYVSIDTEARSVEVRSFLPSRESHLLLSWTAEQPRRQMASV